MMASRSIQVAAFRRPKQTFLQRRPTDSQEVHEKMFNIANCQRNANQNYSAVSPHINQSGHHKKSTNNKSLGLTWAYLVAQMVKNLPAMQETQVQSLGQEDPLEEEMATYSGILAWRIPQTEEPGGLQSVGSKRVRYD